jgi:hypothetical protein
MKFNGPKGHEKYRYRAGARIASAEKASSLRVDQLSAMLGLGGIFTSEKNMKGIGKGGINAIGEILTCDGHRRTVS